MRNQRLNATWWVEEASEARDRVQREQFWRSERPQEDARVIDLTAFRSARIAR
jgi:hypothetical protein